MHINGEAVRREITAQGRTHRWIADQCDITPSALSRYLAGSRECPGPVYARLVRLLNVHPTVFIGPEDPERAIVEAADALDIDPLRFAELHRARFPEFEAVAS